MDRIYIMAVVKDLKDKPCTELGTGGIFWVDNRLSRANMVLCGKLKVEGEKGMQDVLVAVSKHGLSVAELTGLRALNGKVYDCIEQFYEGIDEALSAPGATVKVIFGNATDWAEFLENEPFDSGAFIYISFKVESLLRTKEE